MRSRQSAEMTLGASPPTLPCSLDVPYLMLTMYARPVLGCRVRSAFVPVISFVVRIGKDKLWIELEEAGHLLSLGRKLNAN